MNNSHPLVLRTYRQLVLLVGGGATAAAVLILVRTIQINGWPTALEGIVVVVAVEIVWVNYLFFHYVELDHTALRKVSWFGLIVQEVPLTDVDRVSLGGELRAIPFRVPTVVVEWGQKKMTFYSDRYPEKVLLGFVKRLKQYGVVLAPELEEAIRDPK